MPLGEIDGDRTDQYLPLSRRARPAAGPLHAGGHPLPDRRPGALRARSQETGGRLGFITPMTHNFCESCNRVRLTCTGTLYMCLGQEDAADLRAPLRASRRRRAPARRHRRGHRAASPRATTSSSTARHNKPGRRPPHERHRRLSRASLHSRHSGATAKRATASLMLRLPQNTALRAGLFMVCAMGSFVCNDTIVKLVGAQLAGRRDHRASAASWPCCSSPSSAPAQGVLRGAAADPPDATC